MTEIDERRIAATRRAELDRFAREHPRSRKLFERAGASLISGVPMTWMAKWAGGHPVYAASARGATIEDVDLVDVGGVGGTLAGNALSLAAARATLQQVLTAEAFDGMIALCDRFVAGVRAVLAERDVRWSIVQLGARAELAFAPDPPRNGGASAALHDAELEDALHLFLLNRGVMITPPRAQGP